VRGIAPSYEQKTFNTAEKTGRLRLVASPDGAQGSVTIHADAALYAGLLDADQRAQVSIAPGRKAYVQLLRGSLKVNGKALIAGDAAVMADEISIELSDAQDAEVLVFDLAA
jgi:redox-sensitive bicupin YhaK (pirin superfamily)